MTADPNVSRVKNRVVVGPELGRLLDVSRAAGLPVLLVGRHGIGKSEYMAEYARERDLEAYVLDLSLLEATDLTGIPYVEGGVTRFAPPSTLPVPNGRASVLVLEELNRCDRSVRQPCLQLLTARRLNQYQLPENCFLAASVNPPDLGYDVDELDPALASRFVTLHVEPDREAWLVWARSVELFGPLIEFIDKHPQALDAVPPRTWTYAGRMLQRAFEQNWKPEEVARILETLLPTAAAHAFALDLTSGVPKPPPPIKIMKNPAKYAPLMQQFTAEGRIDLVREWLLEIDQYLEKTKEKSLGADGVRDGLLTLVLEAPADLRPPLLARLGLEDSE